MTGPQISAANKTFDKANFEFAEYGLLQNALKQMLFAVVDPIYLQAISQSYVGLGKKTVWDLLNHLYKTYAKITPTNLKANDTCMNQSYDPNQPFEFLIKRIQNATDFVAHAGISYLQPQILATA